MNNRLNRSIGIVGCGSVTQKFYMNTIPTIPGFAIQYVCDTNEKNATIVAEAANASVVDFDTLIDKSDNIIIATPPNTHYNLIKSVSKKKNKTIICEKPFVSKLAHAKELIHLCHSNMTELFIAHFRRYYPSVQLARDIIRSGILGKITGINIFEGARFSYETKSGYIFKDPLGGVLLDTGSHSLDMALYSSNLDMQDMEIYVDTVERTSAEPSHEIHADFTLRANKTRIAGRLFLSRFQSLSNKIDIISERGSIEIPVGLANRIRVNGPEKSFIMHSNRRFSDILEVFALQYNTILNSLDDNVFYAERFLNLTSLIEQILEG